MIGDRVPLCHLLRLERLEIRDREEGVFSLMCVDHICCTSHDLPFRFVSLQKCEEYLIALKSDFYAFAVSDENHTS